VKRTPGFTAESSESKPNRIYSGAVAGRAGEANAIVGQFWRPNGGGFGDCNPNCVCLWPNGCPCCIGPGPGRSSTFPVSALG